LEGTTLGLRRHRRARARGVRCPYSLRGSTERHRTAGKDCGSCGGGVGPTTSVPRGPPSITSNFDNPKTDPAHPSDRPYRNPDHLGTGEPTLKLRGGLRGSHEAMAQRLQLKQRAMGAEFPMARQPRISSYQLLTGSSRPKAMLVEEWIRVARHDENRRSRRRPPQPEAKGEPKRSGLHVTAQCDPADPAG